MLQNTFAHGRHDAIRGHGKTIHLSFISREYLDGYQDGERYKAMERRFELIAVGALAFIMGGVTLALVARGVVMAV